MLKKLLFIFFIFILHFSFKAQVVINEYSCSNISGPINAFGDRDDWVELYNTSAAPVNLTGFHLSDKSSNMTKWQIPSGTIPANGYLMVHCSGKNTVSGGELHPNFKLTQTEKEWIILANNAGVNVDSLKIVHFTKQDHSVGRQSDGASTWKLFLNPTPNAPNAGGINFYTPTPAFSLISGFYTGNQFVTITCSDPTATIRYTTTGATPTAASTIYVGPINIATTSVLRAIAFSTNEPSFTQSGTYFIDVDHTVPVISIASNEVSQLLEFGDNGIEPQGFFEYFESDGSFISKGEGEFNKHGNDSWAYDQRGFDYIMRDQYGYNDDIEHQIFPEKDRDEFQKLIIKAAANDNYPAEDGAHIRDAFVHTLSQKAHLKMDERTWKPCVLYLNGQYWGVYDIREKVDDSDFTEHYFDQGSDDLYFLKTWGGTWEEYGAPNAQPDWDALLNYIQTNNMGVQANFDYVDSKYNWNSLVDYFVLNSYVVCMDWLNWNTAWWKGNNPSGNHKKWRYALWDMDATFGHYINYTGIPDESPNAMPCAVENLVIDQSQGHPEILQKLINENPVVEQYYINRYADLLNTYLSCDYMNFLLDSMIAQIEPEMNGQIAKWGGSYAGWQAQVQELRNFINARCVQLNTGMVDCYPLTGPYSFQINVSPANSGTVQVNSLSVPTYPWSANYFGGIENILIASPIGDYLFDHWEYTSGSLTQGISEDTNALMMTGNVVLTAVFALDVNPDTDGDGLTDVFEGTIGTNFQDIDSDDDGLNDSLEVANSSNPLDICDPNLSFPSCDPDNDGLTNVQEQSSGTNPGNPDSDLDGISDGQEINNGSNPLDACSPNLNSNLCDSDNDGLLNSSEIITQTDPLNPDTDGDGLSDGVEFTNGTNPLNICNPLQTFPSCDPDGDGLDNQTETNAGTDGNNSDTDGDLIADGVEISNGSNPLDECSPNSNSIDCLPKVSGVSGVNIPSAFSPDGDFVNDFIRPIVGADVLSFNLKIFDRWGNKMFSTSDANATWDGTFNGKKLNEGVYAYMLEITFTDDRQEEKGGNITLIRKK
ncbi:MAG: CotH kinase family protein [Bacteroidota bacterium]